jgi:hypothetical protein
MAVTAVVVRSVRRCRRHDNQRGMLYTAGPICGPTWEIRDLQARVHCLTLFSFSNDKVAETAKTPRSHAF